MSATLSLGKTANIPSLHCHTKDYKQEMLIVRPSNYHKSEVSCSVNCHPCRAAGLLMVSSALRKRHPRRLKLWLRLPEQKQSQAPGMWAHYLYACQCVLPLTFALRTRPEKHSFIKQWGAYLIHLRTAPLRMQADECYLITAVCPCIKRVECDTVRVEMEI